MSNKYDAISSGLELFEPARLRSGQTGKKNRNVDKLPGSGLGSTSVFRATIRLHYPTPDGVAMAREGYYYWLDWPKYLGMVDPTGMVKYINTVALCSRPKRTNF